MFLKVNNRVPLHRRREADFVVPLVVDVLAEGSFLNADSTEDGRTSDDAHVAAGEFLVGRVEASRLEWCRIEDCSISVRQVCELVSPAWKQVFRTLTRKGKGLRRDLLLDNFVYDIVAMERMLLHPEIVDRVAVLDAVLNATTNMNSLIIARYAPGQPHQLHDWEYHQLGFKKIARSDLLLRNNHLRYPFGDLHPAGRRVDFQANLEHETWFLSQWEELTAGQSAAKYNG